MAAKVCPRCGFYNSTFRKTCSLCSTPLDGEFSKEVAFKTSFYKVQSENNANSFFLVLFLFAFLIGLGFLFGRIFEIGYFGPIAALAISVVTTLIAYGGGKAIVMSISGAKRVTEREEPEFVHIVQEMSIASGVPMPETYIIETDAMNAFATGRDPKDGAVAITRGLLNKLTRDEISGVMAHEMAHIKHLDIRFSMLVGVLVGTIVMISDWMMRYMFYGRRSSRDRKNGGGAVLLIVAIALAIISPILAKLIQMAVSRKRELMADARAAEFTRNPEGLASALEKIGASSIKLDTATRATAHMFISNPFKDFSKKSSALFSTHPPIESRIRLLRSM
ncbi:MAG: M48 family metallopeptidase [bacterium]|nr:M48 family metallopeptidase [bacterium]